MNPSSIRPVVKLPLGQALRTYWWILIGMLAFPALLGIGKQFLPFEVIIVLFFGFGLTAAWPVLSGRAPYSFWLVAAGLCLLGAIVAPPVR